MKTFLLALLASLTLAAAVQEQTTTAPLPPSEPVEPTTTLSLFMEVPDLEFTLKDEGAGQSVSFKPNDVLNWGLDGSYDGYQAGFSLPLEDSSASTSSKGKTSHLDMMFGHYWDSFGGDVYYQRYHGFYVSQGDSDSSTGVRGDLGTSFYGVNFYFAFSPSRFPLTSLNNFKTDDEGRGGSWLLMAGANDFLMSGTQPLVAPDPMTGAALTTAVIGGGYGYRVAKKNHVLSAIMLIGAGPQWQTLRQSSVTEHATKFSDQITMNFTYAYRWDKWLTGMTFKLNEVQGDVGFNENFSTESFDAKIFMTRTF